MTLSTANDTAGTCGPLLVAQRQDSHVYVVVGEDVPRAEIAERLRAIAAGVPTEDHGGHEYQDDEGKWHE